MIDERAKAGIEAAVKTLETIDEYTETSTSRGPQHWQGVGIRAATHGADFRALRDMLHALDPDNDKNGGALSRLAGPRIVGSSTCARSMSVNSTTHTPLAIFKRPSNPEDRLEAASTPTAGLAEAAVTAIIAAARQW